ncbi:MAG: lectin-like protein [Limisphaerales bacterium]
MKGKVAFIVILLALATVQAIGQALWNGNGHYYQVVGDQGVDWATANALADASTFDGLGGHLATITSAGENSFVTGLLPSGGNEYWLGGYQVPPDQPIATAGWTWVNGEGTFPGVNGAFGYANAYSNWNAGEPNDNFGLASEQFMAIWASTGGGNVRGTWNDDGDLGDITGYVVEYQKSVTLVSGTVSYICDSSPIAGATVNVGGYLATTDGNGHYSITNAAAVTIQVSA